MNKNVKLLLFRIGDFTLTLIVKVSASPHASCTLAKNCNLSNFSITLSHTQTLTHTHIFSLCFLRKENAKKVQREDKREREKERERECL